MASIPEDITGSFPSSEELRRELPLLNEMANVDEKQQYIKTRLMELEQANCLHFYPNRKHIGFTDHRLGKLVEMLDIMQPVLDSLFPQGWDVQHYLHSSMTDLYLHYPEVTVTNKDGMEHRMTDLYVRFSFNDDFTSLTGNVQGTRGSLTNVEYGAGFCHPHLPEEAIRGFVDDDEESDEGDAQFCQGETFFRDMLSELGEEGMVGSEDAGLRFEAMLHQLRAYLEHEASDGNPYYHIANLGKGTSIRVTDIAKELNWERFCSYCRDNGTVPKLTMIHDRLIVDRFDPGLEDLLLAIATRTEYKGDDGNFYEAMQHIQYDVEENPDFREFDFRGKTITQRIIDTDTNGTEHQARQKYCHREIRQFILDRLDVKLGKTAERERELRAELLYRGAKEREATTGASRRRGGEAGRRTARFLENLVALGQDTRQRVVGDDILPAAERVTGRPEGD